jgi:hypothetical protein
MKLRVHNLVNNILRVVRISIDVSCGFVELWFLFCRGYCLQVCLTGYDREEDWHR